MAKKDAADRKNLTDRKGSTAKKGGGATKFDAQKNPYVRKVR